MSLVDRRRKNQRGLTLVELIVSFTIMLVLSTMALPLARYKIKRDREIELREALEEMRKAIDKYKDDADSGKIGPTKLDSYNYPESLDVLVEGVKMSGAPDTKKKYLRRIPRDPFTNSTDWGKRSMQDDPDSTNWGGQNVFDVYTTTTEKDSNGVPYSEW